MKYGPCISLLTVAVLATVQADDLKSRAVWVAFNESNQAVAQIVLAPGGRAVTSGFKGDEAARGGRGFWVADRKGISVFRAGGGALRVVPRGGDRSEIFVFDGVNFSNAAPESARFRAQPADVAASATAGIWMIQDPANRRLSYLNLLADGTARDSSGARGSWRPMPDGVRGQLGRRPFALEISNGGSGFRSGGRSLAAIRVGDQAFEITP